MSPAPTPVAALGDTLTLTLVLLAVRYLLLWRLGALPSVRGAAKWVGRIAAVTVILPALRLISLTAQRPDVALQLWGFGLAIFAVGALALAADIWIVRRIGAERSRP